MTVTMLARVSIRRALSVDGTMTLAVSDLAGEYQVVVTDLATGARSVLHASRSATPPTEGSRAPAGLPSTSEC